MATLSNDNLYIDAEDAPIVGSRARRNKASKTLEKRQMAFKPKCPKPRAPSRPDVSTTWRVQPQIPGLDFLAVETWMTLGKWYSKECNVLAKKYGAKVRVAYDADSETSRRTGDALIITLYGNAASMAPTVVQEFQAKISNMTFPISSPWTAIIRSATVINSRGVVDVLVDIDTEVRTIDTIKRQYVIPEMMRMYSKNLPTYLKKVHSGHWVLQNIRLGDANDTIRMTLKITKQISDAQLKLEIDNLDAMLNFDCPIQVPVSVQANVVAQSNDAFPITIPL